MTSDFCGIHTRWATISPRQQSAPRSTCMYACRSTVSSRAEILEPRSNLVSPHEVWAGEQSQHSFAPLGCIHLLEVPGSGESHISTLSCTSVVQARNDPFHPMAGACSEAAYGEVPRTLQTTSPAESHTLSVYPRPSLNVPLIYIGRIRYPWNKRPEQLLSLICRLHTGNMYRKCKLCV